MNSTDKPDKKHKSSHRDKDRDSKDSKRHKSSHHRSSHSSKSRKHERADASDDDDEWVEKKTYTPAIAPPSPTRGAPVDSYGTFSVGDRKMTSDGAGLTASVSSLTDGFGEGEDGSSAAGSFGGIPEDLFSAMGTEVKRREIKEKPDPTVRLSSDPTYAVC